MSGVAIQTCTAVVIEMLHCVESLAYIRVCVCVCVCVTTVPTISISPVDVIRVI